MCLQSTVVGTTAVNETSVVAAPIAVDMTLEKFLRHLKLEVYLSAFKEDGYDEVEDVLNMTLQDIMDISGMKKGHAKRIFTHVSKMKS